MCHARHMSEKDRQKCHWWISIARQELGLDRERCANEIVIGKHLETCANPMEGWKAFRRFKSTCAHAYYHGRKDVICRTQPGEAIWDTIANNVQYMLGIDYLKCLQARTSERNKHAWYRVLLESYELEGCMSRRIPKYCNPFFYERIVRARQHYWMRKHVVDIKDPEVKITNEEGEVLLRDLPREYKARMRQHLLWKIEGRGLIYANRFLDKVLPHALGECEAIRKAGRAWTEEPARVQKLQAWEEIAKILQEGFTAVKEGGDTLKEDYCKIKSELEEVTALMWKWNLFLPRKPLHKRVSLVRPRLGQLEGVVDGERQLTDQQVFAAHTNYYAELDRIPPGAYGYADYDSDETASSGLS